MITVVPANLEERQRDCARELICTIDWAINNLFSVEPKVQVSFCRDRNAPMKVDVTDGHYDIYHIYVDIDSLDDEDFVPVEYSIHELLHCLMSPYSRLSCRLADSEPMIEELREREEEFVNRISKKIAVLAGEFQTRSIEEILPFGEGYWLY